MVRIKSFALFLFIVLNFTSCVVHHEIEQIEEGFSSWQNLKLDPSIELPGSDTLVMTGFKNYLIGKTDYTQESAFVLVDDRYCNKKIFLRRQVYHAFISMYNDAMQDGVKLLIVSGARNFDYQKGIWERKWKRLPNELSDKEKALKILEYSSMPATSRHHWGTDIDLNYLENEYFEEGEGLKIYEWLQNNAHQYGFYQVYTDKNVNGRRGYETEKWHYSYMPLAEGFLINYNKSVRLKDIKGFIGHKTAKEVSILSDYVNGINPY